MLNYLREQTDLVHKEVENNNLAKYIIDHSITEEQYRQLLIQNFRAYKSIENAIIKRKHLICDDLLIFVNSNKSDFLRKDLQQFPEITIDKIKTNRITIQNEAEIIGALYVIEGSMLGSLLLSRNIIECRNLKNIASHFFYSLHNQKEKTNNWRAFSDIINNKVFLESEKKRASLMAKEVFRLF